LWERGSGVSGVEVKGDRHGARRSFFFELVSNLEKDSPGCFLYSEADLLLYVFVAEGQLYELPMPAVRKWFLDASARYPLKRTRTRTGAHMYTTVGASVPVRDVVDAVPGSRMVNMRGI